MFKTKKVVEIKRVDAHLRTINYSAPESVVKMVSLLNYGRQERTVDGAVLLVNQPLDMMSVVDSLRDITMTVMSTMPQKKYRVGIKNADREFRDIFIDTDPDTAKMLGDAFGSFCHYFHSTYSLSVDARFDFDEVLAYVRKMAQPGEIHMVQRPTKVE